MTRDPEFDEEQYQLLAALEDYESGLGHHGLPLEETMSLEADPNNREGSYFYEARVRRDWYDDAVEQARNDPQWKNNPSTARHFTAVRVERPRR